MSVVTIALECKSLPGPVDLELSTDVSVRRLLPELIRALGLPSRDYELMCRSRRLPDKETLATARVRTGDILVLRAIQPEEKPAPAEEAGTAEEKKSAPSVWARAKRVIRPIWLRVPKPVLVGLAALAAAIILAGSYGIYAGVSRRGGIGGREDRAPLATAAAGTASRPAIIERDRWEQEPGPAPDYRALIPEFVTVVHTGTSYPTQPIPEFFAELLDYETSSFGYIDLDSHFYVDREGHIYAARPLDAQGEIGLFDEQGHILVHAIGNYEEERPTTELRNALVDLIAWLCVENDIPLRNVRSAADWSPDCDSPGLYLERALAPGGHIRTRLEALLGE